MSARHDRFHGAFFPGEHQPSPPDPSPPVQSTNYDNNGPYPTCLSRHPMCENPRVAKPDGLFDRLCEAHRQQQQQRNRGGSLSSSFIAEQLHHEPLPFELIPFDSGQTLTLWSMPVDDLDELPSSIAFIEATGHDVLELSCDEYAVEFL